MGLSPDEVRALGDNLRGKGAPPPASLLSPRSRELVEEANARLAFEGRQQERTRRAANRDPLARKKRRRGGTEPKVQPGDLLSPSGRPFDDDPETCQHVRLVAVLEEAALDYHHSPNGERRTREGAGRLRRMGTQPGFPDLVILTPPPARPGSPGAAIEMKAPERRPARPISQPWAPSCFSDAQRRWLERLQSLGWAVSVAYTAEDAVAWLADLGYPVRAAVERLRAAGHPGWRCAA